MTDESQPPGQTGPGRPEGEIPPDRPGWASLNRETGAVLPPDSPTAPMGTPFPPPGSLPPASALPPSSALPPASPLPTASTAELPADTPMAPPGAGLAPGPEPGGRLQGGPPPGWGTAGMDWRDMRRAERAARRDGRRRGAGGGLVFGLILMLVGGYFLVRQAIPSVDADRLWPILSIVVGGVLVVLAFAYGDRD